MALAIFGITNSGLNLVATLFLLMLVVALAGADRLHLPRRPPPHLRPLPGRLRDVASFFPYIGTAVYAIVRPPEFLEDAHERELEIKAAELRVRQLTRAVLPQLRVPGREELPALPELPAPPQGPLPDLRQAGRSALGPLPLLRDQRSAAARERQRRRRSAREPRAERREAAARGAPAAKNAASARRTRRQRARACRREREEQARAAPEAPTQTEQRSPSREPDPDPRQA